jgi:hypothetical protein
MLPRAVGRGTVIGILAIAAAAAILLVHAHSYNYVVDDAYISFRYARNLVEGKGLVFNPGERVEGYTNFLWVILIALGMKLGANPTALAQVLCFGFAALSMVVVYRYFGLIYGRRLPQRLLPLAMIALAPPIAVWALAGLETTMFAFLVTAAVLTHVDQRRQGTLPLAGSVLAGLAALTRPEGLIFAAILFVDTLLNHKPRRHLLLWLLPISLIYAPYFFWRYSYYGFLFPNTFYAKTGGGTDQIFRGLLYAADFLKRPGGMVCLLAFASLFLGRRRWIVLPLLTCLVWAGYVVAIGGDGLAMYRFAVPVLPVCCMLASEGLLLVFERIKAGRPSAEVRALRAVAVGVCLLLILSRSLGSPERDFVLEDRIRVRGNWVAIGQWLGLYARPGESVAVTAAGAVPYYSGLYTIDMLGITDRHIAHISMDRMGGGIAGHEKHDMEYVLSRKPTYIFHYPFLMRRPVITRSQFETDWNPGLGRLPEMPAFRAMYEPISEQIAGLHINFFRLKQEYR